MNNLDLQALPSPCFVVDRCAIEANLRILDRVQQESGAKILLALKGFALWKLFPLISQYLAGTTASGIIEARLGHDEFGKEIHVYAPAYTDREFAELAQIVHHASFNSMAQWRHYKQQALDAGVKCAIRINPAHSEVTTALYDPCAPRSRLGVRAEHYEDDPDLSGLHFHTLCECDVPPLQRTLAAVEKQFGKVLERVAWVNLGGGHHITRPSYQVDDLIELVVSLQRKYNVQAYLEPGEAIALHTGVLVSTVLDVLPGDLAILDTSATAHMPDTLEMPYRARITQENPDGPHTYRLGGLTCLAGDVIGDYSFSEPLKPGDKLVFEDMAHYTMVKTTMFNGINLPAIAIHDSDTGQTDVVRQFAYEDYKHRLA